MTERDQFEEVAELHGLDTQMLGESRAYMAQTTRVGWALWQESRKQALEEERAEQYKLADALQHLLSDSQHADHVSCDDGGFCPVRDARRALEAFIERDNAIRDLATKARTLKKEQT